MATTFPIATHRTRSTREQLRQLDELTSQIPTTPNVWIPIEYAGTLFNTSGAVLWTVGELDMLTLQYVLDGTMMTFAWHLVGTTVSAGTSPNLRIRFSREWLAKRTIGTIAHASDNGTVGGAYAYVIAQQNYIYLEPLAGGNWAAATNATDQTGQITFEVTRGL